MTFSQQVAQPASAVLQNHPYAQLASTGVVGTLLLIALGVIRHLYNELKEERKAHAIEIDKRDQDYKEEMKSRIEDAKKYNALAMAIQKEVMDTVNKLGDWFEILERRDPRLDSDDDSKRRL